MRRNALIVVLLVVAAVWQAVAIHLWGAERVQGNVAAMTLPVTVWFVSLYARDPWWRSWFGRSLMLIAVAVFLYTLSVVLFRNYGDYPGRDIMLVASADATFLAMLVRTLVLRSEQKADCDGRPTV